MRLIKSLFNLLKHIVEIESPAFAERQAQFHEWVGGRYAAVCDGLACCGPVVRAEERCAYVSVLQAEDGRGEGLEGGSGDCREVDYLGVLFWLAGVSGMGMSLRLGLGGHTRWFVMYASPASLFTA